MKYILFLFILILVSFVACPQIELHGYVETGYTLLGHHTIEYDNKFEFNETFYIDLQFYFLFSNFILGGNIITNFDFKEVDFYIPFLNHYTVFFSKKVKNFEFGFSHTCVHSKVWFDYEIQYDGVNRRVYLKLTY